MKFSYRLHPAAALIAGAASLLASHPLQAASTINGTTWFPVGPAPVTQGQVYGSSIRVDVAGRTSAIAINPQNPQDIYLGTANGGVWQTTDGGQHWRPRSDQEESLAIGALVLDNCSATDCNTIYAGTGENGIRRDTYRGAGLLIGQTSGGEISSFSWTLSGASVFRNGSINNVVLDPAKRIFVTLSSGETASASESTVTAPAPAQGYGIFRSPAGGGSWTKLTVAGSNNAKPSSLVIDPTDGNTLYAGFLGRGVFKSTDGGDNWCPLDPGISVPGCPPATGLPNPSSLTFDFVVLDIRRPSAAQPAVLYASFGVCGDPITADCQPGVFRSLDGGATWSQRLMPIPGSTGIIGGCPRDYSRYSHVLKIDPTSSDRVYLGGYALCLSTDGGQSYSPLGGLHPDQHDLAFDPTNPQHLFVSNDGGLYHSTDGNNWLSLNYDLQITEFQSISSSPLTSVVIGGTQDNGTEMWTGNRVWQHIDDGDSGSTVMDLGNVNQMYDVYTRQCPRRSDGVLFQFADFLNGLGVTHDECFSDFVYPEDSAYYPSISQDPQAPHALYTGTIKLYRSTDGTSWSPVSPSLAAAGGPFPDIGTGDVISAIAVAPSNAKVVYVGLYRGGIWVSDAGSGPCPNASCWHKIDAGTPVAPVTKIAVHPADATTVYAAFSGFGAGSHLFKRTGGGAWNPLAGGLPADKPVNTVTIEANDPQRVWVGTDAGVYKSTDGGGSWNPLNNGMPNVPVYQISLDEVRGRAWAGTHGRGAFVLTKPMVNNFEGWVDGGIWDIPVYGTGFLNINQSCTVTILRQDGTTCASGSTDGDGGAIRTDDTGQLVTSKGAFYMGRPVVWGCLNGSCVGGGSVAACNQTGNPITSVIVNCNGEIGIEHVNGCQQQDNPPGSVMGLDGTPAPAGAGAGGGGGGPLGAPALPTGPAPPPPPANAEQRAFFITPTVQAGDGSTRALCSVRVPFTVGEERARIIERARDLINASATCAAAGVTARATGIFPIPHGGEDLPAYDPHLVLSAPPVKGSQLMPAFQSDPGQAAGLCFDLQGLGVATSGQLEITRVRFATAPGGAAGGALRFSEISGVGTCEIDVPTAAGQTAGQVAQAVATAFNTPGIPGPFPRCSSRENPRDVVRDGDSVLTVLPHALRLCVGDPGLGIALQPDELKSRYPVANAGVDHEVHSTTVKLDGTRSTDPDSTPGTADGIVQYLWFEVLPDASTVPLGTGPLLTVHLAKGFHHVVLRVTNKAGLSDTATVVIEVEEGADLGGLAASVFLSQAYARGDDGVLFGIPHHGTTDYRDLALRLSYGLTTDDDVVVQLRDQRRGLDPRPELRSDVDADWAFYEHRFGSGLDARAGRTPVPVGIWNERREAGTRLPFFTAPAAVYQEGGAVNETVYGLALAYPVALGGGFKLDLAAYGGGWDLLEQAPGTALAARARAEDGLGGSAWLRTPIPGLRFGAAASRFTVRDGLLRVGDGDDWRSLLLSVDGSFAHWDVRAEYLAGRHPLTLAGIAFPTVDTSGGYLELGAALTPKLWLHLQGEFQTGDFKRPGHPSADVHLDRDLAVALDYAFRKDLVLKLEGHQDRGFLSQDHDLDVFADPAVKIHYGILTLAVSF
jgi:photosystem II stability/assembly factor-like uncharacterized protein